MTAGVRQLLGLAVASVSFLGSIIICALPQWRVTKRKDTTDDNFYVFSEGLWKFCVTRRTYDSVTECWTYDSETVSITQDLEVARALIVIGIINGIIGILLGVAGSKFINFVSDEKKRKMAMASGVVFLIANLFLLIPVCWITNTIDDHFHSDLFGRAHSVKMELGASVYIGWITTVLWFLGGGFLCSSFL